MTNEYKWRGQLDVGKRGEEVVLQWLKQNFHDVLDVRSHPRWQARDVDFIVETSTTAEKLDRYVVEVKTDEYDNDALFLELYAGNETKPGALFKSRADVWLYYKVRRGILIEFSPAEAAAAIARLDFHENLKPVLNLDERTGKKRIAAWGVRVNHEWIMHLPSARVHQLTESADDVQEVRDEAGAPGGSLP